MKQPSFEKTIWTHRYAHGGTLRRERAGRRARPLSTKHALHLVFKIRRESLKQGLRHPKTYALVTQLMKKYSKKFFVPIDQVSIQNDHIHLNIRPQKRALTQHFFRVFAGQLAQQLLGTVTGTPTPIPKASGKPSKRLWKYRPFTRVIQGHKHQRTLKDYIQLNEKEARGEMKYRKERLRGLKPEDYERLWA